eukprot:38231-Chlamydomonas_euryale.AAC.6
MQQEHRPHPPDGPSAGVALPSEATSPRLRHVCSISSRRRGFLTRSLPTAFRPGAAAPPRRAAHCACVCAHYLSRYDAELPSLRSRQVGRQPWETAELIPVRASAARSRPLPTLC